MKNSNLSQWYQFTDLKDYNRYNVQRACHSAKAGIQFFKTSSGFPHARE
jgi:hypothetical protein